DMPTAESFWGSDTNCPNTIYTIAPHKATCNGNGDGRIAGTWNDNTQDYEMFRAWQQLTDAGILPGGYTGTSGTGADYETVTGINIPAFKLPQAGWTLFYMANPTGALYYWPFTGHILAFGASPATGVTGFTSIPVLTPSEAFEIDNKIDDGLPAYGNVRGMQTP